MISVGDIVQSLFIPLFDKNPHLSLMVDWSMIVGQEISCYTSPKKILHLHKESLLYLYVKPSHEMLAWSNSPVILERVNQYLGGSMITRVRFLKDHAPFMRPLA
jgi:hypothetical protein